MADLMLSHDILMNIEQPARYIGNEINMVVKDPNAVDIRFAMCFPDVYEIGMSHMGIQIIYEMLNRRDDVYCERVYSPWTDLDKIMRDKNIPLFALESQDSVRDFDFLGITIQYEMCYTNILQVLDLAGISIYAKERKLNEPFVIGGGPCAYNPEPLADFFDLFYIGEGETSYYKLLDAYKEWKKSGESRQRIDFLKAAAQIEGIYVPCLYDAKADKDGRILDFKPNCPEAPETVKKQLVHDMGDDLTFYPKKPLVSLVQATQDRVSIEIQRGCIRGCRFCQAGMIYRPVRQKDVNELKELAVKMLDATGHEEISLLSLSSSDYDSLEELVTFLIEKYQGTGVNLSLPSLRIDAFSLDVMSKVQDVKKSSLTFAPEAGSQRLRNVINKGLTKEDILRGSTEAFKGGWTKVKLYFMLGLPTETDEDRRGIADLSEDVAMAYYDSIPRENRIGKKVQVTASSSFFIPKPFTPLQWAGMHTYDEYMSMAKTVNDHMKEVTNHKSIKYNWHDAKTSVIEGFLARGGRDISKVIVAAYKKGCIYDAWTEYFDYDKWIEAARECGIDLVEYTIRERDIDEHLPWDFIDIGVKKSFLLKEYENALNEKVTKNCKEGCSGCGAGTFAAGICLKH